jgi:uncharacterized membrane protein YsdA (DUF1294 family)
MVQSQAAISKFWPRLISEAKHSLGIRSVSSHGEFQDCNTAITTKRTSIDTGVKKNWVERKWRVEERKHLPWLLIAGRMGTTIFILAFRHQVQVQSDRLCAVRGGGGTLNAVHIVLRYYINVLVALSTCFIRHLRCTCGHLSMV